MRAGHFRRPSVAQSFVFQALSGSSCSPMRGDWHRAAPARSAVFQGGAAYNTPWGAYLLGATAGPGGVPQLLGREPRLEFFVRRGALRAEEWELLRPWLVAQELPGG